jgi:diacylglycerol O-acyltransferase / wax synthase
VDEHLNALDATFLELEEADDSAHMHIGGVMILEPWGEGGAPPLDLVRAELEARIEDLPRYRQRLSSSRTGGLHWPRWEEDRQFDIARHVVGAGLPVPRGEEELLAWAGEYFSQRLDRARPLWEMVLIDLADGRWAMISKAHHCLVDGVGSVDVVNALLDPRADADPWASGARWSGSHPPRPRPAPTAWPPLRLAVQVVASGLSTAGDALHAGAGAIRLAAGVVAAPLHGPRMAAEAFSRSRGLAEVLIKDEVIAAPHTSLNEPIGTRRSLTVLTAPLAELKEIKESLGGTVNDVVLAATTGGLRRLLRTRGEELPGQGLRAMVPVNIRSATERLALGNRITSLFVALPIAEADPLARYRRQVEEAEGLKSGSQAAGSLAIVSLAGHAPPVLHSFLARSLFATRLFNLTITNVPGPQFPLYAFGSRLVSVWPLVPLAASHSVGLAVFSYNGAMFFCLNVDRDSVPDLDVLAAGIRASIDELQRLAATRPATEAPVRAPRRSAPAPTAPMSRADG